MSERTPLAQAMTDLVFEAFRLNGCALAAGNRLARRFGQSSARWQVLELISEERLTVAQIARRIGLTRQSVQRTAGVLARTGLLDFIDNPDHRRAPLCRLSPKGRRVLQRLTEAQIEWSNGIGRNIGEIGQIRPAQVRTAIRVMEIMRTRLEREPV